MIRDLRPFWLTLAVMSLTCGVAWLGSLVLGR
jgi:hypothetical protein